MGAIGRGGARRGEGGREDAEGWRERRGAAGGAGRVVSRRGQGGASGLYGCLMVTSPRTEMEGGVSASHSHGIVLWMSSKTACARTRARLKR